MRGCSDPGPPPKAHQSCNAEQEASGSNSRDTRRSWLQGHPDPQPQVDSVASLSSALCSCQAAPQVLDALHCTPPTHLTPGRGARQQLCCSASSGIGHPGQQEMPRLLGVWVHTGRGGAQADADPSLWPAACREDTDAQEKGPRRSSWAWSWPSVAAHQDRHCTWLRPLPWAGEGRAGGHCASCSGPSPPQPGLSCRPCRTQQGHRLF